MATATGTAGDTRTKPPVDDALIVITGDDVYEDLFSASLELQEIAIETGFVASVGMGMARFAIDSIARPTERVVILYTAMGEFTADQQEGLDELVRGGTGLVAIHASNVFGQTEDGAVAEEYRTAFGLIGSRYASHGPQPHESRFTVRLDPDHPITAGIDPFEIGHEHYALELAGSDPAPDVIAWRETGDGDGLGTEPLVHVRESGAGRVCYVQLGHDMRVWDDPSVRRLLARAISWAGRKDDSE